MKAEEYLKAHTIGSMHIQGFYVMSKDAEKALEIKEREHQEKLRELAGKIIETRDMITKPNPMGNMHAEDLTRFGHGYNAGIKMALEILDKAINKG